MPIYALTGLIALALKAHYSLAGARDLGWILAPTALLVGWLRGEPLRFDASHGWVPDSHRFVIAPACAGVNFLILAFCAAVAGFTGRFATARGRWAWLAAALVGAYLVTIGVNAIRIVTAVALYDADLHYGWLTAERIHRLAGTVIYLTALSATWLVLDRLSGGAAAAGGRRRRSLSPVVPLLAYVGMTVGVPWLNGAWGQFGARYVEHGATVAVLALVAGRLLSSMCSATSSPSRRGTAAFPSAARGEADGQDDDPGGRGRARDR